MILKSEPLASRLKRSLGGWCDFLGLGWIAAIWKLNPAAPSGCCRWPFRSCCRYLCPLIRAESLLGVRPGVATICDSGRDSPTTGHQEVIKYLLAGVQERSHQKSQAGVFMRVVADPEANTIHVGLLRGKSRDQQKPEHETRACRRKCSGKAREPDPVGTGPLTSRCQDYGRSSPGPLPDQPRDRPNLRLRWL